MLREHRGQRQLGRAEFCTKDRRKDEEVLFLVVRLCLLDLRGGARTLCEQDFLHLLLIKLGSRHRRSRSERDEVDALRVEPWTDARGLRGRSLLRPRDGSHKE